jgi:fructosamine-3-kinase
MFLTDGSPALIDPAAVYGDRELDLGVTTVFGGFNSEFYRAYAAAYPFDEGY